jgi:outer membrane protein assembly factor BamC
MKLKLIPLMVVMLPACGQMQAYFPDKEKDYQLTKEISELTIPDDLSGNETGQEESAQGEFFEDDKKGVAFVEDKDEEFVAYHSENTDLVDLIKYSDKSVRIEIKEPFVRSWRIVGKALTHHSIEITNRDVLNGVYFIQYDPAFEKVDDGSIWDELTFVFGADPAKEKEYRVELVEKTGVTVVTVSSKNEDEESKKIGDTLIELLYGTIETDLADS